MGADDLIMNDMAIDLIDDQAAPWRRQRANEVWLSAGINIDSTADR